MQSDNIQNVLLIQADLGLVQNYNLPVQPEYSVTGKDSLQAGEVFLWATVNEMVQIVYLCKSLEEDHRELLRETRAQLDQLNRRKKELELLEKRKSILKVFQFRAIKRAKRAFREDARGLWVSTRTTSGRLKRNLISSPASNFAPVESGAVRGDQRISGLAIPLPPSTEMNAPGVQEVLTAAQKVASILASAATPSTDPSVSSSSLDGQSSTASSLFDSEAEPSSSSRSSISTSPTSPGTTSSFNWLSFNVNCNIINNTDSNAPGFTINNGSENMGSTFDGHSFTNSEPS